MIFTAVRTLNTITCLYVWLAELRNWSLPRHCWPRCRHAVPQRQRCPLWFATNPLRPAANAGKPYSPNPRPRKSGACAILLVLYVFYLSCFCPIFLPAIHRPSFKFRPSDFGSTRLPHLDRSFGHGNLFAHSLARLDHKRGHHRCGTEPRLKLAKVVQELCAPAAVLV